MYQGGKEGLCAPHALYCIRLAHLLSASLRVGGQLGQQVMIREQCRKEDGQIGQRKAENGS